LTAETALGYTVDGQSTRTLQRLARKEFSAMRKLSFLLLGWLFFSTHQSAFAQDAKLIEAAKKEGGKVVVYTTQGDIAVRES
jgi:hypothetical protein